MRVVNSPFPPKLKDYLGPIREDWNDQLRSLCGNISGEKHKFFGGRGHRLRK